MARAWRPDLVLWGARAFAGAVAAEAVGAVHAPTLYPVGVCTRMRTDFLHAKALQLPEQRTDAMRDWPADWAGRYGVEFSEDLVDGRFTLAPLPEAFRPDAWPVAGITVLVRCDRGHRAGLEKTSAQRLMTTETAGPAR